ncbi:MAG TPA: 16S rRNA (guanine(966)-N(2))-methyltransferase RsmD [Syntrophales bacterium]
MRIIAGKAKGRTLIAPKVKILRPTTDRVKESLFNILPLAGKRFLDLFAGAGSVGLEAVSRGASRVILVESHRGCAEAIRTNIGRCGFVNIPPDGIEGVSRQEIEVLEVPVDRGLKLLGHRQERFDVIFADPPYERNLIGETLRLIRAQALMSQDGVLVVQHSAREEIPARREGYQIEDSRRYGETALSFLRLQQPDANEHKRSDDRSAWPDG